MTLAPSRSRTGPAGRYLLSQAVNTCALEPVHFQPVFKLLPRSIIAETTAHCQLSRKMDKSAPSSFSPEPLALSSNIVYLPKTLMASVVGVILLIFATFNPYNTANWLQARLGELHMQLNGEQDDEEDELEGASHADPLSAAKLAEEDDGMDEEEREIARAAARYQLALESERLRVFGAVANASAPAFGGLQIDLGGNHNNGSHTQAGFTERRTMASMMESNLNRGKPLVLSEVPALPSWRSSRRRQQQQQQEQQQESSPSLAPAPASSESSSALAAPSSSSSEASANAAPVEADEQETRPGLAAHSSSGSSNTTLPAIARAPSSFSSTSSSSFSNPYDEEDDDDRTDHSLALSPTSTCALPHSDSQSELFTLYGPPLSPSFGPLDDAEDFARSALGSAAIAAAATFMASSSSAGSGGEVNPPVLRMLEEEERGLARLVRLEGLVDPDDFDLGASGAGEKDWGTTSEQRKRRRLQKQQQQQQQQQRRPFSQVRRFLLRGGGRDGEDHEIHDDDDGETDVEREEEPLFRTQVC
ncbi:hypothetical protein CF319_g7968 [Tilletia indica]|nr:hypothetical protein CF319_g7968 [Tilletia indica]